jgi:hypothetical protein
MAQERIEKRGPEQDPSDVERVRRLEKELDEIMDSDAFRGAMAESARDTTARAKAAANPRAYLQSKGIRLPEGVEVKFSEEFSHCYCYTYDRTYRKCVCGDPSALV